jgi:hypothetical protein
VSEKESESTDSSSERKGMTFTADSVNADIRRMVIETVEGVGRGSVKSRLRAAAKLLGLTIGRVRRYHYGEVRHIPAHEAFNIIKRAEQAKRDQFERDRIKYEARRLAFANSAPSLLARLLPPAVEPLLDPEDGGPGSVEDEF